ncbi:hypothetical protein U2I54_16230 [Bacillus pseudomycoides]|uniref:Phage protein n=1 Tax=Bacillus bingmayongensis TaxID=1150157 RepID=A0ABU5JYS7_9BACI|nr:hypothetical protein [Bacillus pseudomycoides]
MSGKQIGKGYDNRKSDRKLEKMKREMTKQKRKISKGEPRKAVVYLHSSEQQLKDVMQENHELKLEVEEYKQQYRISEELKKSYSNENKSLRERYTKLQRQHAALFISYIVTTIVIGVFWMI